MGKWRFISWLSVQDGVRLWRGSDYLFRIVYVSDVTVSHFDPECRSPGTMPMAAMLVSVDLSFSLPPQDDKDGML